MNYLERVCEQCGKAFRQYKNKFNPQRFCGLRCCADFHKRPMIQRFLEKVRFYSKEHPGCWIWIGCVHPEGYGSFTPKKRISARASRVAWELFRGEIPVGLHVLHRCDVRACVNPSHLFLGTNHDNVLDMIAKGRRVQSYNCGEKCGTAKLKNVQVLAIRAAASCGVENGVLARMYGIDKTSVRAIVTRKNWKHLP